MLPLAMPIRTTVRSPKFGEYLQSLRGAQTLDTVATQLRPLVRATGLKVDPSLLYKIEQGRIPSWPMLAGLCRIYQLDFATTVQMLGQSVEFPGCDSLIQITEKGIRIDALRAESDRYRDAIRTLASEFRDIAESFHGALEDLAGNVGAGPGPSPAKARARRAGSTRRQSPHRLRRS